MKKRKFKITLTPAENSIVIQSLNHLRNTMLRENRDTGCSALWRCWMSRAT